LTIDRPSERDRIYAFLRNKKYLELLKEKEEENKKDNNNKKHINKENKENMDKNNQTEENNVDQKENIKENADDKDDKDNKDIKEDSNPSKKKTSKKIKINEEEIKKDYENSFKYLNALGYTRSFGILSGANFGLIPNPELNECDLKSNKVRYAVLGNDTFWKILTEPEIRFITAKYTSNKDNIGASKELWDLIRQKLGTNSKFLDKIGFEVIYFDTFF
jgi:cobalamin biosynthesis protein CobT